MSGYHILPNAFFKSMCTADPSSVGTLLDGQVSKRLLQLRAILDTVDRSAPEAGRAAGVEASFRALEEVQAHDPGLVAQLLVSPQAGAWAATCLRHLAGGRSGGWPVPLSVELARLGAIAATAALRAGLDVTVRVPVLDGVVSFPTLAVAEVDHVGPHSVVDCVTSGSSRVLLDGAPPLTWRDVARLRTVRDGVELVPMLDDVDPYWHTLGHPLSRPLDSSAVEHWQSLLDEAGTVLAGRHGKWLGTISPLVRCLVPIEQRGTGGMSASSADAPGAIALTEPANGARMAVTLIHEVQHSRLNLLHDLRPLFRSDYSELYYSPWRDDPRPLGGVLHGTFAFLGVADFWGRERANCDRSALLEYARHLHQLRLGCHTLVGAPELQAAGVALVEELGQAIGRLPSVDADEVDIERIATDLVTEHVVSWRLRHLRPLPDEVSALAENWSRGELPAELSERPMRTRVPAAPGGDRPLTRLAMKWVDAPDAVHELARNGVGLEAQFPGTTVVDLSLLGGDYNLARAAYHKRVAAGSTDDTDWALFVVAQGRCHPGSPLTARPELFRAAWRLLVTRRGTNLLDELVNLGQPVTG